MSTYAIGDLQGCWLELQALLKKINFDPREDRLWFVGDLVNRGPSSLECLRFVKNLADRASVVLGNHDLHLLSIYYGCRRQEPGDTLTPVLTAPDLPELIEWLCQKPFMHHDAKLGYTLVHAGIPPQWGLFKALQHATEISNVLKNPALRTKLLKEMQGNFPDQWDEQLTKGPRHRILINYFTRMRFCTPSGQLNLLSKKPVPPENLPPFLPIEPQKFYPWFVLPRPASTHQERIIFGHWAALLGKTNLPSMIGLDTGCVWGNKLTALRLEDQARFEVPSQQIPLEARGE